MKIINLASIAALLCIANEAYGIGSKGTSLELRAQDDETIDGRHISITIPQDLQDGPKNSHIKIVTSDDKLARLDNNGNFLEYTVDGAGHIAPAITLNANGLTSKSRKWPPEFASVQITRSTIQMGKNLSVKPDKDSEVYIEIDPHFTSQNFSPDILGKNVRPVPLEVLDERGRKLTKKSVTEMPFFDAVSVFGTVWSVFDMYRQDLTEFGRQSLLSRPGNLRVFPHMTSDQLGELYPTESFAKLLGNAFYNYRPNDPLGQHVLCFFPASEGSKKYTSHFFDVVAHEMGHYILNLLRGDLWKSTSSDVRAFHESFGDMTALFAVLHFPELRDLVLEKTKGNLWVKSFLSTFGEKIVDRDALAWTDLSVLPSCEEHDLSERLTRALYGSLADLLNLNMMDSELPQSETLSITLRDFKSLFLQTTLNAELTSFSEFGRRLRDSGNEKFKHAVHTSFLRQGINLLDDSFPQQVCYLPKDPQSTQNSIGCKTQTVSRRSFASFSRLPKFY